MPRKYGYTEGCEGCRAKAAGMTQKPQGEACRKRIEQALDGRENQVVVEKMERDLGKTGNEPMAQEPEEVEARSGWQGGEDAGAKDAGGGNRSDENQAVHGG